MDQNLTTKESNSPATQNPQVIRRTRISATADVYENSDEFLIRADLPGVRPEDVDVRFEKNLLSIRGPFSVPKADGASADMEWTRSFTLPGGVDSSRISADAQQGVLTLHLPKQESLKPRQITVRKG